MKYAFPIIDTIDDVLPAITDRDEFNVCEKPGYLIINYAVNFIDTFPAIAGSDKEQRMAALRRECRGIKFNANTKKLICRPFQKFFNLDEKEECKFANVNLAFNHKILEKLDGSMIVPFLVNDELIWGTKMGKTDITEQILTFVNNKVNYKDLALTLINDGYSPIFEWCSRKQRIVIDYPQDALILTAVRHMREGYYHTYDEMSDLADVYRVPVVNALSGGVANMQRLVDQTKGLIGHEGYVIRYVSGYQIKLKADDYLVKHKIKDDISREKNLVEIIFADQLDDQIPNMLEEDAAKVKIYSDSVLTHARKLADHINDIVQSAKKTLICFPSDQWMMESDVEKESKKKFATQIVPQHKQYSNLLFKVWDGKDAWESVKDYVLNNCGTQAKIESVRHILGPMIWSEVYTSTLTE